MRARTSLISLMALGCLASVSLFGANVRGMISGRTGETLTVTSSDGNTIVLLTDNTTTKDDTGLFGLGTDKMASVVLIPGLKVKVDGEPNERGQFIAKTITVDGDDLEASQMIEAGITPTAKQVEANIEAIDVNRRNIESNRQSSSANAAGDRGPQGADRGPDRLELRSTRANSVSHEQKIAETIKVIHPETTDRFMSLADFDVKLNATVGVASGSSGTSRRVPGSTHGTLADSANGLKGFIIEVTGHADSTGSDEINTKLSEDRAKAVITYLMQQGAVPVRHIVAPGAMGEYAPVASNETTAGRAENRRVELKVLVNKERCLRIIVVAAELPFPSHRESSVGGSA